jgi:hypothetical protein
MGNGCPQQKHVQKSHATVGGITAPAFVWRGKSFCCDGVLRKREEDERGGEEDEGDARRRWRRKGKMRKQGESNG